MVPQIDTHTLTEAHQGVHLVVLHHGLWGNKGHVKFIAQQFKKRFGNRILVYRAESNESSLTYDGIDICGQRAVEEISKVIHVIEEGGDISELRGQKKNKSKDSKKNTRSPNSSANSTPDQSNISCRNNSHEDISVTSTSNNTPKKVTQFSYIGYSLGGLIGRFVVGLMDMEKFFDPVDEGGRGIEPFYFVTMATPHLGIRQPPKSTWSKMYNYVSSRMLSRSGEQMHMIDDYVDKKPLLLVMTEPDSIFIKALQRFKRRAVYCNIRNDRSVPFWTASFSDADPFHELEAMEIQYHSGYSSVIESFEHYDTETLTRLKNEREESLKSLSFAKRTSKRISSMPWKKYAFFGILGPFLIPLWIIFASTTISYQGISSRKRTKHMVAASKVLQRIRHLSSTTKLDRYRDDDDNEDNNNSEENRSTDKDTKEQDVVVTVVNDSSASPSSSSTTLSDGEETTTVVSYSFPDLKSIRPLPLLPVQIEASRNLNKLEWKKNIIHIEALNAHASIVVREKRFMHDGGVAAVQHAVDMFKEDGEDE
ncbi:hypothetical protein BGZ80_006080 [Entomortierella chlamydospora]|uniref:DUF676 domain-containing protein n=1 Tax=Entomortierella chlamydospora TaxID=101097 RepID=A0A9P6T4V2_9FUNG|nr:hypothetical protein BGZ80_006080 [Entomortierella chlamydospora]